MHQWDDDRIYQRNCLGLVNAGHEVVYIAQGKRQPADGVKHVILPERKGVNRRIVGTFIAFRKSLKFKHHILHLHDPEFLPYVFLYRILMRKVIFDSHEVYSVRFYQWKYIPDFMRSGLAKFYFWVEAQLMSLFSALIVTTDSMKDMYAQHNRKVIVVRNLHSLKVLENVVTEVEKDKWAYPIIYTSGVINTDRNSDRMIRAFAKLSQEYPNIRLRFAGWYSEIYKNYLIELSKELGIAHKVEFLGSLPYKEQFRRTTEAAIGFIFLEHSRKNLVASSNRLFEYMYCGLPVLAENTPECSRVVEESRAGIIVNSNSIDEVVHGLRKLLSSRDLCEELGQNGKRAVRVKYHFEKDLKNLECLYNKVIS